MTDATQMRLLAADIGGTNTRLQLACYDGHEYHTIVTASYDSHKYVGLEPIVHEFLRSLSRTSTGNIHAACLAIAGPIQNQTARVTNLPWFVTAESIAKQFAIPRVRLINDFEAVGLSLEGLKPEDLGVLQAGQPLPQAPRALIGAGSGLGTGWQVWNNGRYEVLPSEGGHTDFAPDTDLEYELLDFLRKRFGHVSWERVLSGPGLVNIFTFLRDIKRMPVNEALREAPEAALAGAISRAALAHEDDTALQALDLFVSIYGRQAGNQALTLLTRGGVFVAGGIAPKIYEKLQDGRFISAFNDKGRFSAFMKDVPVYVIRNEGAGLLGAVIGAHRLVQEQA